MLTEYGDYLKKKKNYSVYNVRNNNYSLKKKKPTNYVPSPTYHAVNISPTFDFSNPIFHEALLLLCLSSSF